MENYGWSIELNPGYVLIIGNAPDAHIQLDSAYGRAVRVGLQVKDDISCAMLSEYSSSYNTLVNGKSIQRIATVKNHDFISIGDFTAYYNNGKIFFDYGAIRTNGVEVRPESLDIHTTYPVFIRNTRIQAKRDKTPIEILDPGTIPTKPELNLVTSLMPSIIMFALVVLLRGVMSKSNGAFVAFSICSMGVGVFTSIFGIINKQKKYKKDLVKRRDTYLEYIAKKRNEIEAARREELDCLNAQYYSIEQDIEHIENFDPVLFDVKQEKLRQAVAQINTIYGKGTAEVKIEESYRNMREKIEPCMQLIEYAKAACKEAGVEPDVSPIRGGTDGARLSFRGLPCPNLGTGGDGFHGPFEHITVEGMDLSVEIIKNIIKKM